MDEERAQARATIDHHFHAGVGKAVRSWAYVEDALSWPVGELLGVDHFRARVVMATLPSFRARRELAERLGETFLSEALLPEFRALMKRVSSLGRFRNMLAHSTGRVSTDAGPHQVDRIVFGENGLAFEASNLTDDELKQKREEMYSLQKALGEFAAKMKGAVQKTPRVHRNFLAADSI
jgi:hypothetical protein